MLSTLTTWREAVELAEDSAFRASGGRLLHKVKDNRRICRNQQCVQGSPRQLASHAVYECSVNCATKRMLRCCLACARRSPGERQPTGDRSHASLALTRGEECSTRRAGKRAGSSFILIHSLFRSWRGLRRDRPLRAWDPRSPPRPTTWQAAPASWCCCWDILHFVRESAVVDCHGLSCLGQFDSAI